MKFDFDGKNKIINLVDDDNRTFEVTELYSKWKEWLTDDYNNMKYEQAMRSIGGDTLTETKSIAPYIEVMNGWKIKPFDGDYILSVIGNIFASGGDIPFLKADDGSVIVNMETTGNAFVLRTDNEINKQILKRIENIDKNIEMLLNIEQGNWEIKDTQMIFYDKDNNEIMRFNLYDKNGNNTDTYVYKRERV